MAPQISEISKTLPTLVTHVLLLSRMNMHVSFERIRLVKFPPALGAFERLFSGVYALMSTEISQGGKTFPACVTTKRLFTAM